MKLYYIFYVLVFCCCSAYCGGLWLAALYCTVQIAKILQQRDIAEKFSTVLTKAKESFNAILWNGNFSLY